MSANAFRLFIVIVVLLFLFGAIRFKAEVRPAGTTPAPTTTVNQTDVELCAEGYQPSCDVVNGR